MDDVYDYYCDVMCYFTLNECEILCSNDEIKRIGF